MIIPVIEDCVVHPQRLEYILLQKLGKWHTGNFFHNQAQQNKTTVAVTILRTWWKVRMILLLNEVENIVISKRNRGTGGNKVLIVHQSGGVIQHVSHGDLFGVLRE